MSDSDFGEKLYTVNSNILALESGNEIPVWAITLIDIFKTLVTELKSFNVVCNKMVEIESNLVIQKNVTDQLKL